MFSLIACFISFSVKAQFAPAAGILGTTAIYKDSLVFRAWASGFSFEPGPQQLGVEDSPMASAGLPEYCLGKSGEQPSVSLGDGGIMVLQFIWPIKNGEGWDFAVFENSFDGEFLELAFVEVSSDGLNFYRFPASSHTDTTGVGPFAYLDPTKINNLAGKYKMHYGTPFDLNELANQPDLDVSRITHVRIVDVVGSVLPQFCSRDHEGRIVADPWPTDFPSCGFDLDAVGVIHDTNPTSISDTENVRNFLLYPQPALETVTVRLNKPSEGPVAFRLLNMAGSLVLYETQIRHSPEFTLKLPEQLLPGIYILEMQGNGFTSRKICSIR